MLSKIRTIVETYADEIALVGIITLVGLAAFGLGRLSAGGGEYGGEFILESTPIDPAQIIETFEAYEAAEEAAAARDEGPIVGNRNSKIYHRDDCPGARMMSDANKVFFASIDEAVSAGYRAARNCPGLE